MNSPKINQYLPTIVFIAIFLTACNTLSPTPIPPTVTTVPPAPIIAPTFTAVPPTPTILPTPSATNPPVATPTTTSIPLLTPTLTPWTTPVGVTFVFDNNVSAIDKSIIQDGIAVGQHAFGAAGSVIVYAHTNLDALMNSYYRHEKVAANDPTAQSMRQLFEKSSSTGISMVSGAIYLYISERWSNMARAERMRGATHEYFHQVQYALSKRNWQGIQAPTWLLEGSAQYASFRVFIDYQFLESQRVYEISKDMIWGLHRGLGSLEASSQPQAEDSRAAYNLGLVATEYLAKTYGDESVMKKFWAIRATTRTWQDAFRATFGISVEDFYNQFDTYRRANYPSYCDSTDASPTLTIRLERQLPPGSFHASPANYIPYIFCVTGTQVGTWTGTQKEKGFVKPTGLSDAGIGFCGGNCVILSVRPNVPTGMYTFSVTAPEGRKAETTFQHFQSTPIRPDLSATPKP